MTFLLSHEFTHFSGFYPKRLRELEKENVQLRKLVANLSLDNQILKEASLGNF